MVERIHLPEDAGDLPSKLGQKPSEESYSIVPAKDTLLPFYRVIAPKEGDTEFVVAEISEIVQDVFALDREVESKTIFRNVSRYDIEATQWDYVTADTSSSVESEESVIWTDRFNVRVFYPGTQSKVLFSPEDSAIVCKCLPFPLVEGLQQSSLFSKRSFAPSVGAPILVTVAVKMTLSANQSVIKEWGWFSGESGYFFRIRADGSANNFSIVRRYRLGGELQEQEILRSNFNGDKLDGSGVSRHVQNFTNVSMYGIETGSVSGFSARFWVYVKDKWIVVHSLNTVADGSPNSALDERALPISFLVKNSRENKSAERLFKYGTSVTSIGSPTGSSPVIQNEYTGKSSAYHELPLIGIRARDLISGIYNSSNTLPLHLNLLSLARMDFFILVNPEKDANLVWQTLDDFSGIEFSVNSRQKEFSQGMVLSKFSVSPNKGQSIKLDDIFSLVRSFCSSSYSNDIQLEGDTGQQFPESQYEFWICTDLKLDALETVLETSIFWESSENVLILNNELPNDYVDFSNKVSPLASVSLSFSEA